MELHHIGIAANSVEDTAKWYVTMGYTMTEIKEDPIQKVLYVFLKKDGCPVLELVQPTDKTSPVYNILKRAGVSAYHFCYETGNLQKSIEDLEKQDFKILVEPVKAIAFNNRKISFLYHIDIGIIELLEK